MSKVFKDETAKEQNEILKGMAASLMLMSSEKKAAMLTSDKEICQSVKNGIAPYLFDYGDQINHAWKPNPAESTEYVMPFDVVHFEDVEVASGDTTPGMFMMSHFATPNAIPFDAPEAFKYMKDAELPAGTYNIIMGINWGDNVKQGKTYQFTLTQPVPIGGQLAGFERAPDVNPSTWKVSTYSTVGAFDPIETVAVTEGNSGTNLGTFTANGDDSLHGLYETAYGSNRYSTSAIRQYLNSSGENWWKACHNFDRPPVEAKRYPGFMSGLNEDFVKTLRKVKVRTLLNTTTCAAFGEYEDVYDYFFLPSIEQMFIKPQTKGIEGNAWEYWKEACERTVPTEWYKTFEEGGHPIITAINAQTTGQAVWFRSPYRGHAAIVWYEIPSGYVSNHYAAYARRLTPAYVKC